MPAHILQYNINTIIKLANTAIIRPVIIRIQELNFYFASHYLILCHVFSFIFLIGPIKIFTIVLTLTLILPLSLPFPLS